MPFNRRPLKPVVISFDCYGTLIDWETGILESFRALARAHDLSITDEAILTAYSEIEPAIQGDSYRSYREILREVVRRFSGRFGFQASAAEMDALPASLSCWQPFGDTVKALRTLKTRYQLAILSNIDNDLFEATARLLEIPFDWVITAEDVRSYKPRTAHFSELLRRTGLPESQHLHVAESLYDIVPANQLGIPNVWVNRSHGKRTATASSRTTMARPDRTVHSMEALVKIL